MNTSVTSDRLRTLIHSTNGRIFTATFRKRSDGTLRVMTCRTGVHAKNHSRNPDPTRPERDLQNNLITVFDVQHDGYRCIPLESIQEITVDGTTFKRDTL